MTKDKNKADEMEKEILSEKDEQFKYGWMSYTPSCLQVLNTATIYAILMTFVNIFHSGTTNGLTGAIQSTIERRFQFTSQESSMIIVAYEIAAVPISIFITWLGTVGCHRPRWVAGAMLSSAVGCFLYALPHFTTSTYNPGTGGGDGEQDDYTCMNRTGMDVCGDDGNVEDNLGAYMWVFVTARLFLSFGGGGLYTLGITYLDDSLTREKFSLWSSIFASGGVIGPALGFIAGGAFLGLYSEFPTVDVDDIGIDPSDPRWIGAWWLPLLVFGAFILLLFFPMSGYPSDLPGAAEIRDAKGTEAYDVKSDEIPTDMRHIDFTMTDIIPYTKDLLTNMTFIFLTLYVCCDMSLLSAFTIFGPKYVELQFSLTAAQAGMIFGILVVPAGAVGTIAGGVIIDRYKLPLKSIMKLEFIVSIAVICMAPLFLIRCSQTDFAGVNTPYSNATSLNITDQCNAHCMCDDLRYSPICSIELVQYFSPCHAGCLNRVEDHDLGTVFYNCSCISSGNDIIEPEAEASICNNQECDLVPLFVVMIFFAMVGLFMSEAMNISTVIRCMPNKQRVYGMFLSGIIVRFVGTVPGPLIFAAAFDDSCILWQEHCDTQGSCFYYDTQVLAYYILGICIVIKSASVVCMFFAFWLYKPPKGEIIEKEYDYTTDNIEKDTDIITKF